MSDYERVNRHYAGLERPSTLYPPDQQTRPARRPQACDDERLRVQPEALSERRRASLALHNLRGIVIVFVLVMHANLAYLASAPAQTRSFDQSPYLWVAFPIVDARHWLGFDLICAWLDVYLMTLMFFVSGLFVVRGVESAGATRYLLHRIVRLGVPLGFGVVTVMPIALYPVYRTTAPDHGFVDYINAYIALPFAPCGPLWFLGILLGLTLIGAVLCRFARPAIGYVANVSQTFDARPVHVFCLWALVCLLAYVPLALIFTPWRWENWGPFAVQLCRPGLYAVYYIAGLGVGSAGLGVGALRVGGAMSLMWRRWLAAALTSLFLWMAFTGLTLQLGEAAPFVVRLASDSAYALAGACSVIFAVALCLCFGGNRPWPVLSTFAENAFGVYLLHYVPVVWLQYALLGCDWPAPVKALIVLVGAGAASLIAAMLSKSLLAAVRAVRSRPLQR